ncbi:group 1 glycosyl transferase [Clostridium perfringens]|uniref:Group 1 glycosyl transferase n=1 Tax=Clostridium perfringens TaxID=1502 RepID=A0A2X3C997_CLOPF|nr:glycosyltransferase family 4 protein [Clostridium perfringens]SQC08426.1 group 1 glycosyl transferase [Clostridium perfringens]
MITLQILDSVGLGGVEKIAYYIHKNNIKLNIKSYIAVNKDYYDKFIEYYNLNGDKNIILLDFKSNDSILKKISIYRKIIKNINPDIIHTHARRECVSICLLKKIYKDIKHIRTQHMEEKGGKRKTLFEKSLYKKDVDEWITTSKKLLNEYVLKYIGNVKSAKVIYNGIENDYNIKRKNNKSNIIKFGFVGRITKQKGLDILLENLEKLNDSYLKKIHIDIYGDGSELENLKEYVREKNLNNVIFHGYTNKPLEKIKTFDILIMPSRYEGVPLVMLEAMSMGVPISISNVGGVSEIINTGYDGWIINDNRWDLFLKDIIDEKFDIESISKNSIEKYNKRFTKDLMCEKYYEEYINILKV